MIERIESKLIDSNVFVITHENSCIIVDAGVDDKTIKAKVGGKKVEAIFLTHGHYDHCYYAEKYQKMFCCKIYASEKIKEYLINPDYNYSEGKLKITDFSNFVFLGDSGKVNLGSFEVKYKQLGGHSKSDMCYFVDENIFVGDLLIGRDMGRVDLYGGDKKMMKSSLEFFVNSDYVVMHSGHGQDNSKETQDRVAKLWIKFLSR